MRDRLDRRRGALIASALVLFATYLAGVVWFPLHPAPPGALMVPALILAAALSAIPLARVATGSPEMTNAENFVSIGFVLWLLLDLIQGAYDLRDASDRGLQLALVAVGISGAAMWIGAAGRAWHLPQWMVEGACRQDRKSVV